MSEKLLTYSQCIEAMEQAIEPDESYLYASHGGPYYTYDGMQIDEIDCLGRLGSAPIWRLYVRRPHYDYVGGRLIQADEFKDITHMITGEQ